MQYSFACPATGCNYVVKVDANNDDEAVNKIMAAGAEHGKQAHPEMMKMPVEQIKNIVRSGMKKG